MRRYLSFTALTSALVIAIGIAPSIAAPDPGAFIGHLGDQALEVMGPRVPLEQREARFNTLFTQDFAVGRIAQFVLGPLARTLTPAQKQQFLTTFQESLVEAYAQRFGKLAGDPFRVTGVRSGPDEIIVSSEIVRQSGAPVKIDWSLIDQGGQLKITDVKIDGLSMRVQERDQFASLMAQSGNRLDIALVALKQAAESP